MIQRWMILAGEEGGPASNKLGGIWEVIDAEAETLARLASKGEVESDLKIIIAGPYFPTQGSDWNTGKARVTDMSGLERLAMGPEIDSVISTLESLGIEAVTGQRTVGETPIGYVLFNTTHYQSKITRWRGQDLTLDNAITTEAYELAGLDSMHYQGLHYGSEYLHYLDLSYAVSEFARVLSGYHEKMAQKYEDVAISEFARALMPKIRVSLHCHEFGVFYSIARLKKLGVPIRTMATLHATVPGRVAGFKTTEKILKGDSTWPPGTPMGFATLESLARYADVVTYVGDSTMKEALLFHSLKGIVVRNGVTLQSEGIDWAKKDECRARIQQFLSDAIFNLQDGRRIDPENILPVFTISRIEVENKGYPQLLDALVFHDHLLKHRMIGQRLADDTRVVCLLITAHGPKPRDRLPEGFPVNLPPEVPVGEETRIQNMIKERGLDVSGLASGKRTVVAVLYPQWIGPNDGGLGMRADEVMAGCVAGIFPSQYEPFLLTALEAGKEGTPSIVSRVAGFSDALKKVRHRVPGLGGVIVVDNIESLTEETILDYSLGLDYFTWTYLDDEVKYRLLCEESFSLARQFGWTEPVMEYYQNLVV